MFCRVALSLVFFCGLFYCDAQPTTPLNTHHPLQDLSIAQWTASSGLSSNNITSVFQSQDGLLWITSFNGFMHFDGQRTEIFDRSNLPFLETDGFYVTVQDSKGTVWLGSQGSGIIKYDSGSFRKFVPAKGPSPKSTISLYKASNDDILIGSSNAGLYRIHHDTVVQIHHPDLDHVTVLSIDEDKQGTIWVGTDGKGMFSIAGDKVTSISTIDGLLSNSVQAVCVRPEGGLWVGSNQGLQIYDNNSFTSVTDLLNNQVNTVYVDPSGYVWFGTERGLARLDEESGETEWLVSKNGIDFVRVSRVMEDREGNIWVSSNRSGIIRLKETNITNLTKSAAAGISSDRANIIHEGKDGKLYIGTDANQVDVCQTGKCKPVRVTTPVGGNGIRDIYADDDGSLWLATYSGIIHRKADGEETVYNRKQGMPAEDFRVIHRDTKGNFWFATRSGGLIKFRDGKIERIYDNDHGLESNYIFAITEDASGNIYIGTHSGGMSIIDIHGAIKTYHLKKDDAGILIFNIEIDSDGRVWAMANIGPVYFDGKALVQIDLQAETKGKTYFDWIDDQQGNMWITTSIGILQLKKKDVMKFINKQLTEVPFHLLDDSDGMNNKECTGATRSLLGTDKQIYIPTLGGICKINPQREKRNVVVPNIQIAHFLVDNENQPLYNETLRIKPGTLRYTFQFRVLSYSAPDRNRFRYTLEGNDKGWSSDVSLGEVEYTNLPPGEYKFRVTGSNDNDVWNENGVSVSFHVAPYFYQTAWFYLLLVVLVMVTLYGLYRWRVSFIREQNQALKKVNAELDRFVYSASHDLRSPLSSILGLISVARADKANQDMYMNLMEKSVRKLDSFIRDIIEFSRNARLEITPEVIDFDKLFNDIFEDLHFMDNFDKITRKISVEAPYPFLTDPKRLRVILSNIIANAIKHHWVQREDPMVEINVRQGKDRSVEISIRDNGPGIAQEHLEDIFKMFFRATDRTSGSGLGLYIVKETVQRLKGNVTVSSGVNEGTVFTLQLPVLTKE